MYTFARIKGINCLVLDPEEYERQRYKGISRAWFCKLGECKSVFIINSSSICLAPVFYPQELKQILSEREKFKLKYKLLDMVRQSDLVRALLLIKNEATVNVDRRELALHMLDILQEGA
ncbi:hypothetical protein [Desulfolucanica intricata]|uniref:hypothetical protein n=1 Tax=Desulfolucanica intricata TaxID=1285191 RepID=UPI00082CA57C|nr:hypothetical protein [Desulfolucanica intricata]